MSMPFLRLALAGSLVRLPFRASACGNSDIESAIALRKGSPANNTQGHECAARQKSF
jgi:hypothetical protein